MPAILRGFARQLTVDGILQRDAVGMQVVEWAHDKVEDILVLAVDRGQVKTLCIVMISAVRHSTRPL